MKHYISVCSFMALFLLTWTAAGQSRYILGTAPANLDDVTRQYGLKIVECLKDDGGVYLVAAPPNVHPQSLISQVSMDPRVQAIESDTGVNAPEAASPSKIQVSVSSIAAAASDTAIVNFSGSMVRDAYVNQPATTLIRLDQVQQPGITSLPIVAVIDTGIDPTHPAFSNLLVGGYDFTRNQAGIPDERLDLSPSSSIALSLSTLLPAAQKNHPIALSESTVVILDPWSVAVLGAGGPLPPDFGHGTMVAGLIHRVAPHALIMPLKAFHADGSAQLSDVVRAIYYATDNGAKVIAMSFDTSVASPDLQLAIAYAKSHSVVSVAAAGNEGKHTTTYPAGYSGAIGVGSTTTTDTRSVFSNYGSSSVFMGAPGEALITTYPGNNYAAVWGTSFSAALVSGTAALLRQLNSHLGVGDLMDSLDSGQRLSESVGLGDCRLDVLSSVTSVLNDH